MSTSKKMLAALLAILLACAAIWLGLAYFKPASQQPDAPATTPGTPATATMPEGSLGASLVKWAPVEEEMVRRSVVLNGKLALNGNRIHQISARVAGRIDRISVVEGALVQAGQPIAWLYSPEFISAQNEYLLALSTVRAMRQGAPADLLGDAQATLDGAQQKLRVLGASEADVAELGRLGRAQQHLVIRSAISGRLIKRNVDPGGYLDVGGTLGTVADLSSLWFMGHVFDAELPLVRQGQTVQISVNGVDLKAPISGTISFISPLLDADTHSVPVRVELSNQGDVLKPEMFARGELNLGERRLPTVPRSAVVQDGAESFVMVQRGGTPQKPSYARISVQVTPANDPSKWAITSGLAVGEQVVIEGSVLVEREHYQSQVIHGAGNR
jgi:Cu(I)/Ag(I) efflux system membrane fusion protein